MDKERYIWLNGEKIPVNEDVYRTFYRPEWREAKWKEARNEKECSLEQMLKNGHDLQSDSDLVEDIVADKLLLNELYAALAELTDNERSLIDALYCKDMSEREVSKETNIPHPTIHSRKNSLLKKIKRLLEKNI